MRYFALLLFACVGAQAADYAISPDTFLPGKTYTVVIQAVNCNTMDLDGVTPLASGSGLTLSATGSPQKCAWTGTLTVSQDAESGDSSAVVIQKGGATSLIPIHIRSKAAGPIPPGLSPAVDVAWKVLPRRVSSDNFGSRVTKLFYPVDVVIGNNSGYDLQIASILFQLPNSNNNPPIPSDSYYIVRSSLQREQLIGARNTTVNVIKAIGPILTGSSVFFSGSTLAAAHRKTVFQGITNIFSNPFEKGLEAVFPDETVQQLVNLDNHTLRANMIVPNNTQVQSLVFINQDLLKNAPMIQKSSMKHDYDPQQVMAQLGSLQLVGRSIAYLNRVSVISNPPGPAPLVASQTGDSVTQGDAPATLTLTGDSLSGATLTSPDPKLVISNQKVGDGGKSFTATLDASNADAKTYQLVLSTASGSVTVPFEVKPK